MGTMDYEAKGESKERAARLDQWGHIESKAFDHGPVVGVLTRPGGARLVYSHNGDPATGYDRVYWYASIEDAVKVLRKWDGRSAPDGFIRDCTVHPVDFD